MISGVNFQPGQGDPAQGIKKKPDQGVQEAIKVLSLRLPRVVGAQAMAPAPLLNSQGSGGNPRVDSVVNQVLSRLMPTGDSGIKTPAPMLPGGDQPRDVSPQPGESGTMPPPRFDGGRPSPMLRDLVKPEPRWRPAPGPAAPRFTPGDLPEITPGPDAGMGADPFADLLEYLRRQQPAPSPPSDISDPLI